MRGLRLLIAMLALLVLATACAEEAADEEPEEPEEAAAEDDHEDHDEDDDHDHDGDAAVEEFEVLDRDADEEVVAYVHDDHWDGELPDIAEGDNLSLGARIVDADGEEIDLDGDEHALGVELAEDAPTGVVELDEHGDHLHVAAEAEDTTEIVLQWIHDDHTEYESPPLEVSVAHHDHDHDDDHDHDHDEEAAVEELEVVDRGDDEVVAYVHGDHWHGDLPHLHHDEHLSLGARIVDADGEEVELDGDHHGLGVALAEDAEEGVVGFDEHGDHVHVIGEAEGSTEIVLQWIHDDHTEYETPPLEVSVEDH